MLFLKILLGLVAIIFVGGFTYLAASDVSVPHTHVSKNIPAARFLNAP